jgi:hypothetical protein
VRNIDHPEDGAWQNLPLSIGAAHELTLVVADGLQTLESYQAAQSIDEQLDVVAAPELLPQLQALARQHSYGPVVLSCGDHWLRAAVLVLKSKMLLHARPNWSLAGTPPSAAHFDAALIICNLVPHLQHLAATVQHLKIQGGAVK